MRQTFIQTGKITGKDEVKTQRERHHFQHKYLETILKPFKIAVYVTSLTILSFFIDRGVFAQDKFAYAGKDKGGYTEVKKKVVIDKLYKLETGTIEELVEKMKRDRLNPKIIESKINPKIKESGIFTSVVADNYLYIYIYCKGEDTNHNNILGGVIRVSEVNLEHPLQFYYAISIPGSGGYIITNGNGPELLRCIEKGQLQKIPLSPEIQPILTEVEGVENLKLYSRGSIIDDGNGNKKVIAFSYVFGFNKDGSLSKSVVVIRDDGDKRLWSMETLEAGHQKYPALIPTPKDLLQSVIQSAPTNQTSQLGTTATQAKLNPKINGR